MTASRIEAVLDVDASQVLDDAQKERVRAKAGPRVVAIAQDARSQMRNRELALRRLRRKLEEALAVPRSRRATRPTGASRRRRLEDKRQRSARKAARRRPDARDD